MSSSSYSYSGIPLTTPAQQIFPANYQGGLGGASMSDNYIIPPQPTPAAGLFYGAEGGAAGLYGFGQGGAGPAFTGAVAGAQGNADAMQSIAGGLNGATASDLTYANQALINAFDPQQQAYKYYLQQVLSTAGAQEAQSGVGATPYGAEVTGATAASFGNNWQTQQIQRENTGMQTATGLQNQYLTQQKTVSDIFDQAGTLDLGAASSFLSEYGLQGSNMAAALQAMTQLFGDMRSARTSRSSTG